MLNIIVIFVMIYLVIVLRVYSLTLFYTEFDKVRKYSLLAPIVTVRVFLYALAKKEYSLIKNCFVFHLPATYIMIGLQSCLMQKEYVNKICVDERKTICFRQKNQKIKPNIKVLLEKTEKLMCQY